MDILMRRGHKDGLKRPNQFVKILFSGLFDELGMELTKAAQGRVNKMNWAGPVAQVVGTLCS